MEDVLDTYEQPYDPKRPVVCMDEQPCQLIGEELVPIEMKPGQVLRDDNQYVRNGTVCNFMFFEPLGNWRRVSVREHRTQKDWAEEIAHLLDVDFPEVQKVVLVMDNLNTHKVGSLYVRFPAERAREYVRRLEIRYTPKHGSWLDSKNRNGYFGLPQSGGSRCRSISSGRLICCRIGCVEVLSVRD